MIIEERGQTNEGYEYIIGIHLELAFRLGYVGVYEDSPLYNVNYTKSNDEEDTIDYIDTVGYNVHVHGGLTYSGTLDQNIIGAQNPYFFGFDCAHLGDGKISLIEMTEVLDKHCGNLSSFDRANIISGYSTIFQLTPQSRTDVTKEMGFVKNECFQLSKQLKALESNYGNNREHKTDFKKGD